MVRAMGKVVVVIAVTALVAGCAAGGSSPVRNLWTAPTQEGSASNFSRSVSCIAKRGYGGLGASTDVFDANNNNSTGPSVPTPGAAWYQVIGIAGGCVTAYQVQDSTAPPLKAHDMLDLVSTYLPGDAKQLVNTGSCAVWTSASLLRAIGLRYAKATAIPQLGSLSSGSAQMKATSASTC
jgi:hypothetical protein